MKRTLLSSLLILFPAAFAPAQARLELGKMWTFENPPLGYLKDEYGFEPTQEWLDALRLASLRFGGGCSASFVSPKGLIMTNHHCVRSNIATVSPQDEDWVKNGFYAAALEDEVVLPGLTVQQLVSMEDITGAMNEGIADDDADATVTAKRSENRGKILEGARERHPDLDPQVVSLHQGARHQLYFYKVYSDVRLVCAPHLQTAHFGGDPDNFTYPRYSLDFSFCRAYEDGEPADTSGHYFRWSSTGPMKDELTFVTGNPGTTDRLKTLAQMEYLRDASYPMVRQLIDRRLDIMRDLASQSPEMGQTLRTQILAYENGQKAYQGYHGGLMDRTLMAEKAEDEAEFKGRVRENPELQAKFGDVWDQLEEISALRTSFEPQRRFHSPGGSTHLARALTIVRAVTSSGEQRQSLADRARGMDTSMRPDTSAFLIDHLDRARDWLPGNDPYRRVVLGDRTGAETAALLAQSAVSDGDFVEKMLDGGEAAVRTSGDPAMQMAWVLAPLLRAKEKLETWLTEQEQVLGVKVGQAMFACYGNKVSPDATFTLRFSDGLASGFEFNGTIAPFRTSFYGLYARNAEFDNKYPFNMPQVWLDQMDRIDKTVPVNFVSKNDIIGGNSGSPIVNKDLEVIGLIFDGNIEMLPNKFLYTDEVPRAVSVHVRGIMEALTKIYGARRVADELLPGTSAPRDF